ncbi:MAG TPA: hypothetical protein VFC31_01070 [Candidatus Limnocylindria bacterium]|nr:hypothetical protein [Candidatus Limnocylindria bacterium]
MPARRLALGIALALLAGACSAPALSAPAPSASTAVVQESDAGLGEQSSEAGSVTVVVSWLSAGVPTARVAMDTHSVDLDRFDLKDLARVRLDGGAWVAPSAWDAPAGGHHRSGTLAFASLSRFAFDAAKLVELEIRDVVSPSRLLRWERPR